MTARMIAQPKGHTDPTNTVTLASEAETRAIVEQARRLRAETLAGLWRSVLSGIGRGTAGARVADPASVRVGGMPHARA